MLNFNCKERAVMGHLGCFNFSLKIPSWKTTGFVYQNNCLVKLNVKQIFFAFNVANNVLSYIRIQSHCNGRGSFLKQQLLKTEITFFGR